MPTPTSELENSRCELTRPGIFFGGEAECPCSNVKCKPTPSFGFSFANFTASSKPGSFTIKLALVKMPSRCAQITASLAECDRPKSSALTISRLDVAIIGCCRAQRESQPRLENQGELVWLGQFQRLCAKDIEFISFQFLQQPPIDRAHQFSSDHRFAVFRRQSFLRQSIKIFCSVGDARCQREITFRIF